jgi:hypothetical protein
MHMGLEGLKDDVTVLVIDLCAHPADRLPAALAAAAGLPSTLAGAPGGAGTVVSGGLMSLPSGLSLRLSEGGNAQVWKPLEAPSVSWRCDVC